MSSKSRTKLNSLLKAWPNTTVITYPELKKFEIYQQLVSRYIKSNWLEPVGRGAFIRPSDRVDWTGALYAIQKQLYLPVHAGGKSALELMGTTHFLTPREFEEVWLFAIHGISLPSWFTTNSLTKWNCQPRYTTYKLFDVTNSHKLGLTEHVVGDFSITIASKERAILEVLYFVPHKQSLVEAKYLSEGLMTLRPDVLQLLLEKCTSFKVKRLFLFLADFCNLPCLKQLDVTKIDLGKGKRKIGNGGHYVSKYLISIPQNFVNTFREEFAEYE